VKKDGKNVLKNVRIWSADEKRCEAIWFKYFLTLCGCQVFNVGIKQIEKLIEREQYIDIVLFSKIDDKVCKNLKGTQNAVQVISGNLSEEKNFYKLFEYIDEVDIYNSTSLKHVVRLLSGYIADSQEETDSILDLFEWFTQNNSEMAKRLYIVNELFYSKKINYKLYKNYDLLEESTTYIKKKLEDYVSFSQSRMDRGTTWFDRFAATYLKNVLNSCYIKIRSAKRYDVEEVFNEAVALYNEKQDSLSAKILQLLIASNGGIEDEKRDRITDHLKVFEDPEFSGRVYGIAGDIFYDGRSKEDRQRALRAYRNINYVDSECFVWWYKLATLYEEFNMNHNQSTNLAIELYMKTLERLDTIGNDYTTPTEIEIYCKSYYKQLQLQLNSGQCSKESLYYKMNKLFQKETSAYRNNFFKSFFLESSELCDSVDRFIEERFSIIKKTSRGSCPYL
jgi:hypothetical protein